MKLLKRLLGEELAASALEYTLTAALIAAAVLLAVQFLGSTVTRTFTEVNSALASGGGQGTAESPSGK